MLYVCTLSKMSLTCIISLWQRFVCFIELGVSFFLLRCIFYMLHAPSSPNKIPCGFIHFSSSLCLSPSPCSHYKMLFCAGVPQRPCMKFIGPESRHLTRKTWLTDPVPFPISCGSRVKLTFPASGLYLNSEHQRLMAPREILLSTLSICLT